MTDTFKLDIEYTDTFGGEANYCWVRRAMLVIPFGTSDRAIMRRAKAALGLSGVRGRTTSYGDMWQFQPYGRCTVMLMYVRY